VVVIVIVINAVFIVIFVVSIAVIDMMVIVIGAVIVGHVWLFCLFAIFSLMAGIYPRMVWNQQ